MANLPDQVAPPDAEPNSKSSQPAHGTSSSDEQINPAESTSRQDLADSGRESWPPSLILALAQGQTIAEASKISGVSERTIYRYQQNPNFRDEIVKVRHQIVDQAVGQLAAETSRSVKMMALMRDFGEFGSVRLAAANSILGMSFKARERTQKNMERDELEQRVQALEAKFGAGRGSAADGSIPGQTIPTRGADSGRDPQDEGREGKN